MNKSEQDFINIIQEYLKIRDLLDSRGDTDLKSRQVPIQGQSANRLFIDVDKGRAIPNGHSQIGCNAHNWIPFADRDS